MVMDYLPYRTLFEKIKKCHKLDEETTAKIVKQIVLAIRYMHS